MEKRFAVRDRASKIPSHREKVLPSHSTFKPRLRICACFDEAVAVLSPKQGKCADTGKVRTYPAPQSKI